MSNKNGHTGLKIRFDKLETLYRTDLKESIRSRPTHPWNPEIRAIRDSDSIHQLTVTRAVPPAAILMDSLKLMTTCAPSKLAVY